MSCSGKEYGTPEVGVYKRKMLRENVRKHAFDQEKKVRLKIKKTRLRL